MYSIKNEIMIYSVFSRNYYRKYTLRWACIGFMYFYLVGYGYSYHTILGLIPLLKAMCWNELTRNKKILIYSLARLDIAILISVVLSNNLIASPQMIRWIYIELMWNQLYIPSVKSKYKFLYSIILIKFYCPLKGK